MSDPGRPGAPVLEPQRGQAGPPRDAGSTAPAGVPLNLSVNLDPVEAAVAFEPTRSLVRTPRSGEHRTPVSDGSPSTFAKVLLEKEARKAAEEQARLAQLREARVEHFKLRTRLLATDKGENLETSLVLDWSAGAAELGRTFAHALNRSLSRAGSAAEEAVPEPAMLLGELRQQWSEATCLLRSDLTAEASFEQARSTVRESLAFLDSLADLATSSSAQLHGGTGALFQALLKDLARCGLSGMMIDNVGEQGADMSFQDAAEANALAAELGATQQWPALLRQAHDVRCIVRIKLQDANDLKAAQYALECCSTCFQEISAHAQARRLSNFQMAQLLEGDEE